MAKTVTEDPQIAFEDRFIEDPELDANIDTYLEFAESAATHAKAKKAIALRMASFEDLQEGQRVRTGKYVIPMKARSGGGFQVPVWTKSTFGKIQEL